MPVYTYRCRECENDFDAKQRFTDDPLTVCQVCGTEDTVFRVVQAAGVVFKGSGFYVTDTRGANSSASPAKSNGNSNGATSSDNGKSGDTTSSNDASSNTVSAPKVAASDAAD